MYLDKKILLCDVAKMMKDFCMCVFVPRSGILMRQLKFQNEKFSIQESIGIGERSIKNGVIIGIYEKKIKAFNQFKVVSSDIKEKARKI